MPAASHVEKAGTFTNTQRLIQFRDKALEPPGDARSELWFMHHLFKRVQRALRGLDRAARLADREPDAGTTPSTARSASPTSRTSCARSTATRSPTGRARRRLRRPQGRRLDRLRLLDLLAASSPATSTRPAGATRATSPSPAAASRPSGPGRGPPTAASSTTRASADPEGKPWSERKKHIWWDAEREQWTGYDVPDFPRRQAARLQAAARRRGHGRDRRRRPVHHDGRRPRLAVRAERPARRPDADPLRADRVAGRQPPLPGDPRRTRRRCAGRAATTRTPQPGDPRFPHVATTFRLTEHHTAGGMSRWLPWLAELQPEMFAEIDPVLAAQARASRTAAG